MPVVETVDNTIHWINFYLEDKAIVCPNTYLLDSELSGGKNCSTFERPGPGLLGQNKVVSVSSTFEPPCATTSHEFQPPISN